MTEKTITIRAAVLEAFNQPFVIRDITVPIRENETVLEVRATGICGRDRVIWAGGFRGFPLPLVKRNPGGMPLVW